MNNGLLIQGSNVHVFLYLDSTPFEIVCAENLVFNNQMELIGATTPDSGTSREYIQRLEDSSFLLTGCSTSDNDSDISIFYLINNRRELFDIEVVFTDNNGSTRSIRANCWYENCTLTSPEGDMSGYELSLKVTGGYVDSELQDPEANGENVTSDSYTVAGGVIQDNAWIGLNAANIIAVYREGSEQLSIGLPYSFNSGTGTITPDAGTTIDGQRMFVIWSF